MYSRRGEVLDGCRGREALGKVHRYAVSMLYTSGYLIKEKAREAPDTKIKAPPPWNIEWAPANPQDIVKEPLSMFRLHEEPLGYPISPEEGTAPTQAFYRR